MFGGQVSDRPLTLDAEARFRLLDSVGGEQREHIEGRRTRPQAVEKLLWHSRFLQSRTWVEHGVLWTSE